MIYPTYCRYLTPLPATPTHTPRMYQNTSLCSPKGPPVKSLGYYTQSVPNFSERVQRPSEEPIAASHIKLYGHATKHVVTEASPVADTTQLKTTQLYQINLKNREPGKKLVSLKNSKRPMPIIVEEPPILVEKTPKTPVHFVEDPAFDALKKRTGKVLTGAHRHILQLVERGAKKWDPNDRTSRGISFNYSTSIILKNFFDKSKP